MKPVVFAYRAITEQKPRKFVYGYPVNLGNGHKKNSKLISTETSIDEITRDAVTDLTCYTVRPETLSVCTGQADNTGRVIFTNDIVETDTGTRGTVRFGKHNVEGTEHLGFYVDWSGETEYSKDLLHWLSQVEVIGTVHDVLVKEAQERCSIRTIFP